MPMQTVAKAPAIATPAPTRCDPQNAMSNAPPVEPKRPPKLKRSEPLSANEREAPDDDNKVGSQLTNP